MDNLPIDPQAIIFIVVALIGFLQSIFSKKKKKEQPDQPMPPFDGKEDYDDPMRDFRRMIEEARQEAKQPQQKTSADSTAPKPTAPVIIERSAPEVPVVVTPPVTTFTKTTPPKVSSYNKPPLKTSPKTTQKKLSVKALLSSPSAARQAIILTEVLGTPKGLR